MSDNKIKHILSYELIMNGFYDIVICLWKCFVTANFKGKEIVG